MICPSCGNEIDAGYYFCFFCGAELPAEFVYSANTNNSAGNTAATNSNSPFSAGNVSTPPTFTSVNEFANTIPPSIPINTTPPIINNQNSVKNMSGATVAAPVEDRAEFKTEVLTSNYGDYYPQQVQQFTNIPPNNQYTNQSQNLVRQPNIGLQGNTINSNTAKSPSNIRNIYFIDFMIRLFSVENIPLFIYLCLNILIIGFLFMAILGLPAGWAMLAGFIAYLGSLVITLSPMGEEILRLHAGCRKINNPAEVARIKPLFDEVYSKARRMDPNISEDVRIYINEKDNSSNAFAMGKRTICITRGLLEMPDGEIKAIMGHEFGHLSHKDTDRILIITVSNFIIELIFLVIQAIILIFDGIARVICAGMDDGIIPRFFTFLITICLIGMLHIFMRIWSAIGVALCMKTSRNNEFQADDFSRSLGYGAFLVSFLQRIGSGKPKGIFATLASSHPDNMKRIDNILTAREGY